MGTRSLTAFIQKHNKKIELCTMYRQYDGYPEEHGVQLAKLLYNDGKGIDYNGIGCLAAQVIAHFKKEVGIIYIEPTGVRDVGEEYVYEVYNNDKWDIMIRCYDVYNDRTIFVGTPEKFIEKYEVKQKA